MRKRKWYERMSAAALIAVLLVNHGDMGIMAKAETIPALEENLEEEAESHKEEFGYITVIENVFGYKQILPLQEGDNVIGRRCVGTSINTPIESGDMSMDRRHCIINIKRNKQGKLVYTLRDAPSLTGTFLMNEILGDKDRVRIEDGAIVTIGATTFILHAAE
mgnify:FL=1